MANRYWRWFCYSLMLIYPSAITPPVWIISLATTDTGQVKDEMAARCPESGARLYSRDTLAFDFISADNPFQTFTFAILLLALVIMVSAVLFFSSSIFYYLQKQKRMMSERTRQMHRTYIKTLLGQVTLPFFV